MVANPKMMITNNKNRSGFLLRGAGMGGVGPYCGLRRRRTADRSRGGYPW